MVLAAHRVRLASNVNTDTRFVDTCHHRKMLLHTGFLCVRFQRMHSIAAALNVDTHIDHFHNYVSAMDTFKEICHNIYIVVYQ